MLETLRQAVLAPFWMLVDPSERVFWPFLASALVLAFLHAVVTARGRVLEAVKEGFVGRQLWLHPSARLDYQLVFAKSFIRVLLFAPWLVTSTVIGVKVMLQLHRWVGTPEPASLPPWLVMALYTGSLFVASDLSRFVVHLFMHHVPFLWQLHQVHHSAEVLTPFTEYRTHPLEELIQELRGALTIGVVVGIFSWWRGANLPAWEVLGVNGVAFWLTALGSNLRHSHVWLSFGPLELWILSPAQHQLHHDASTGGHRVNYGSFLAIWDRLWGSFVRAKSKVVRFGLAPEDRNHDPAKLGSVLVEPVRALFRRDAARR